MLSGKVLDLSTDGIRLPYLTFNNSLHLTSINRVGIEIFGTEGLGKLANYFFCKVIGSNEDAPGESESKETKELRDRFKSLAKGQAGTAAWGETIIIEYWKGSGRSRMRAKCEAIITCYDELPLGHEIRLPPTPPISPFPLSDLNLEPPCSFSLLFTKPITLGSLHAPIPHSIDARSFLPSGYPASSSPTLETSSRPIFYSMTESFEIQEIGPLLEKAVVQPVIPVGEHSEGHYKHMIENLPQIAFTANTAGLITYFNLEWYKFTGLSYDQSTDVSTLLTLFWKEDMLASVQHWIRAIETGSNYDVEYRVRAADGEWRWCVAKGRPFKDENGVIEGWIVTITPVDELIQARLEALRIQKLVAAVLHGAGIMLLSVDRESLVTFCECSNLRKDTMGSSTNSVGQPLADVWPDVKVHQGVKRMLDENLDVLTWQTSPEDALHGQYFQYRLVPLLSAAGTGTIPNEVTGVIVVAGDISSVVAAKVELEKSAIERSLLIASETAAKEASRLKTEFVTNISHEIRTPIAAVIGICEILLDDTSLKDGHRGLIEKSLRSAEILLDVVGMVLDLGKVEAGKLLLENRPFLLREAITDAGLFSVIAQKNGIEFIEDIGPYVLNGGMLEGDRLRLRQVLANGLSNAVKFTKSGSITLKVRQESETATQVNIVIEIRDTGIGIDKAVLPTLFTPFMQADPSTARLYGGTGLGLVIAKNLIELMGGSIALESQPAVGTCMTIRVPFSKAVPYITNGAPCVKSIVNGVTGLGIKERTPEMIHILLAEDNDLIREIVIRTLKKMKFNVTGVIDGAEAVKAVEEGHFHLILMDGQMSGMDGYQATAQIRALSDPVKRNIKIIALTASAFKGDKERCLEAGMDGYLAKPVRSKDLEQAIWEQLDNSI